MNSALVFAVGALLLGAVLGSFLNALLLRYGTGHSALKGRSRCMRCRATLKPWDLVPVISFFILRGRCRSCSTRISLQYPLVEAAGAALSLAVFLTAPTALSFFFWLAVFLLLLFIVVYDMRHLIIPTEALLFLLILALVSLFLPCTQAVSCQLSAVSLSAGPLLAAPLFLLSLISRGRWMGWSDSGLMLALGWLLGLEMGITALLIGFWAGALVGIGLVAAAKGVTMKSELPLAPFLALGAVVAHLAHANFFSMLSLWS